MPESRRPRVVVTIHGIRTHGEWQKKITPYLAAHGLVPYHIDYGWFGALKFFLPWTLEQCAGKADAANGRSVPRSGHRAIRELI